MRELSNELKVHRTSLVSLTTTRPASRVIPLRRRRRGRFGRNARKGFVERPVEPVLLEGLWVPHAARQFEDVAAVDMQPYCGCIAHAFDDVRVSARIPRIEPGLIVTSLALRSRPSSKR